MKVFVSFSKGYALGLCFFALASFFVLAIAGNAESAVVLENELSRESYLKNNGYSVDEPFSVKEIVINGKILKEYTYIIKDETVIRLNFDGDKLVGERYDRYKTG